MEKQAAAEMTDQFVMKEVLAGDLERLGVLFDRYNKQLFNFFYRLTGNRLLSEDLVQEVFLRILKYRHTWQDGSQFRTWMYQIARNTCIDHARRNPQNDVSIEGHVLEFICPLPAPDAAAEKREDLSLMLEALARLSQEKRQVLLLRGFQGLKFEEIAGVFQCSVNTIKGRAFTAIRELRTAMNQLKRERV